MLVLSRKRNQEIVINDNIAVHRREVHDAIQEKKRNTPC